jgi:threonine dehydratase
MLDTITLHDVESALSLVQKHLLRTPLVHSPEFSEVTGNDVYLKLESFQRTHAFKARGALNKLWRLSQAERERGVIAASSGNHALGVAYSSALLGIEATVVMPSGAPATKIALAKHYGANVLLHGQTYDGALAHAQILAVEQGKTLVPSFDDLEIIAGQGTIALEVLDSLPDVDLFLAPIGGGGLVSGLSVTLSELQHPARVVGIQAEGAASMRESVRAGRRIKLPHIETIADGIAVQQPGKHTFDFVQRYLKEILTVTDAQIYEAMSRMIHDVRVVVEPAAAAPVAALLFNEALHGLGKTVCCIITGGNISDSLLRQVVQGESLTIPCGG